jgi:hypothetical protein
MNTLGISELEQNLRIFASVVGQWLPVVVGLACFAGLAVMFSFSFIRAGK